MEIVLASTKGEWFGSGAGDIFDLKVPIKKNTRFVLPGKYQFSFEQGMRVDPLPLIMDLGFEVEKSEKETSTFIYELQLRDFKSQEFV